MPDEPFAPAEQHPEMAAAMRDFMARAVLFQEAVARSVGLNSSDLQAVGLLLSEGPATPGELAARIGITQGGAITGLVDRLERTGYVARVRDTDDRRKVRVVADASRVFADVGPVYARVAERWNAFLDTLTPDEIAVGTRVLAAAADVNRIEIETLRAQRQSRAAD